MIITDQIYWQPSAKEWIYCNEVRIGADVTWWYREGNTYMSY